MRLQADIARGRKAYFVEFVMITSQPGPGRAIVTYTLFHEGAYVYF